MTAVTDQLSRHKSIRRFTDRTVDDGTLAAYYRSRGTNLKTSTWTRQMAKFMAEQTRPHRKSFLEKKGFFLK